MNKGKRRCRCEAKHFYVVYIQDMTLPIARCKDHPILDGVHKIAGRTAYEIALVMES
ncbi:MAG: hypothetical protein ACRD6W_01840 [Nitrososphaerales archaeon]